MVVKAIYKLINNTGRLLALQLLIYSCSATTAADSMEGEVKPTIANESVTEVVTATATTKNFEYRIQTNGKLESLAEQVITCPMGGNLLVCHARNGVAFEAGKVIAQLETTPLNYRLERARLAKFNSEKEYESQLLGYGNLLKDKSNEQTTAIQRKLKISTGLAGAEQEIKEAEYDLSRAIIKAPFYGMLADVKIQQGQEVKAGQELFRIYDPHNLLLKVKVLEADIPLLKTGALAEITPVSAISTPFKASVFEINPYVDENGLVTVKLKIVNRLNHSVHSDNINPPLFPGMNCTAVIRIAASKSLVVPREALVMRNGKAVIFSLEDGKAKWNYVVTDRDNGKEITIKEGLKPGVKVIIGNNLQLAHDAPVKEITRPAGTH